VSGTHAAKAVRLFVFNVEDMKSSRYDDDCSGSKALFDGPRRNQLVIDVACSVLDEFIFQEIKVIGGEIRKKGRFVTHPNFDWIIFREERIVTSVSFLHDEVRTCLFFLLFFSFQRCGRFIVSQGGTGIRKKDPGSIFLLRPSSGGLTNYVIRHNSI
jgi:hypothetical protein